MVVFFWMIKRKKKREPGTLVDFLKEILLENAYDFNVDTILGMASTSGSILRLHPAKPNANYWERVIVSWDDQDYWKNLRLHR